VALESRALRRLRELAIVKRSHLSAIKIKNKRKIREEIEEGMIWGDCYEPTDLDEDGLDAVVPGPVGEDGELGRVDFTVGLRNEGQVDARDELDRGRPVGVVLVAAYLE